MDRQDAKRAKRPQQIDHEFSVFVSNLLGDTAHMTPTAQSEVKCKSELRTESAPFSPITNKSNVTPHRPTLYWQSRMISIYASVQEAYQLVNE